MTQQFCKRGHDTSITGRYKTGTCKECNRLAVQEWQRRNREKGLIASRRWREANREKARASAKAWQVKNPEKTKELARSWHQKNANLSLERYAESHRDSVTRRRVQLLNSGAPYKRNDIYKRDKWTCQLCLCPVDRELKGPHPMSRSIHHIVAISLGGLDSPDNVCLAHLQCNIKVGVKTGLETLSDVPNTGLRYHVNSVL